MASIKITSAVSGSAWILLKQVCDTVDSGVDMMRIESINL